MRNGSLIDHIQESSTLSEEEKREFVDFLLVSNRQLRRAMAELPMAWKPATFKSDV